MKIAAGAAKSLEYQNENCTSIVHDRRKFLKFADPRLQGRFPTRGLYQALAVASMCIQEKDDSPKETARMLKRESDRERAVAEAKMWGENLREKRRQSAQGTNDNLDG